MGMDAIRQIDRLDERLGSRFLLTSLVQRRIQELIRGSPRMADGDSPMRIVLAEIEAGKIELTPKDDDEI